jgi:EAL domain-containing protein (putative c-di-GMP-specific phosphodiesterase class I)/PleD family two-component response regulator
MKNDIWAVTSSAEIDELPRRSPLLDAKVMMVDDEPLMTDLIRTHLEDEGYTNFVVTNDPREALPLLRREDPGVLLLDLMMPQISGFELLEAIRADRALRFVPVIVLTASTGADAKLRALQLGATDFLSKPVDASELVLRVRNTLAFHQYHSRLINFDPVTGLPNQRMFDRGLEEILSRRDLVDSRQALLSITVPECRQLRESIDQITADGLARAIARRLERFASSEIEPSAFATGTDRALRVARLAADRFGVLLEVKADAEAVEAAVRRLLDMLSEPVPLGPHEVVPNAWIGVSVAPADGDTAEALHKCADLAGTRAREDANSHFKFASPEMNAKSYQRMTLGLQLRGAAQRGELRLHYQPKLDLAGNRVVGAEALVRWQHPEHGLIAPGSFIPLAEELGLICGIGQWVIEQACIEAAGWARAGLGELKVAVNVAKPQFLSGDLCAVLRQAILDSGLPPRQLVLELTESMLMDDGQDALALMGDLKALGVTLSIDDFGTGYSSLSYLKHLPIDELKIDRSFVIDLPGQKADSAIVQAVIDLGHRLGMSVIAEGVETVGQLDCLRQLGCDQYQGFLFSKPVPAEKFRQLLARELSPAEQSS